MISEHRAKARAHKQELLERLFTGKKRPRSKKWLSLGHYAPGHRNIVGIGFGSKLGKGHQITAPESIRIYVKKKLIERNLSNRERIPPEINGIPTDVIETGVIRAFSTRPTPCGVSAAHFQANAGTLGCRVQKKTDDGNYYILSNNHVFANSNAGCSNDPIVQPAVMDGGTSNDTIAKLSWRVGLLPAGNVMDAALGKLIFSQSVLPDILGIGRANPSPKEPVKDASVKKSGRSTSVTVGAITETEADIQVQMSHGVFGFVEQIAVVGLGGPFAADGDSGALVVDALDLRTVGLLFSGSDTIAYINPIGPILDKLQIVII